MRRKIFSIEHHGINVIPDADRRGTPFELFWVWLSANLVFTYIVSGSLLLGFGIGFWAALGAIFIGNLFYALVGVGAIPGPRSGTATLVVSRSAFGVFGNVPAAVLSWLTVVGWEAVNIVIGTFALSRLMAEAHFPINVVTKAICMILVMMVTFTVAVWGHETIVVLQRYFAIALGLGTIPLAVFVLPHLRLSLAPAPPAGTTPFGAWLLALLVVAASPLSWVNYPADYS